eukprot:COSAG02_NODE_2728_length_8148_cov_19.461921_3_plen_75_part_00
MADDDSGGYGTDCKDPCQTQIDAVYADCADCDDWETTGEVGIKATADKIGCGGAAQSGPVLFVALAAVANHFLN